MSKEKSSVETQVILEAMKALRDAAYEVAERTEVVHSIQTTEPTEVHVSDNIKGISFISEENTKPALHLLKNAIQPFTQGIHKNALDGARKDLFVAFKEFRKVNAETTKAIYKSFKTLVALLDPEMLYELEEPPEDD